MDRVKAFNNEQIIFLNKFLVKIPDHVEFKFDGEALIPLSMNEFIRARLQSSKYISAEGEYHKVAFDEIREYWINTYLKNKK